MSYLLLDVSSETDWRDYHALRRAVLWEARGRSGYDGNHPDEHVSTNHPLLLKFEGRPIGTARLDDLGNGMGAVRLVAIAPDAQRQGHGRVLSTLVESYARRLRMTVLVVNAAPGAVGWYEKLGWDHHASDSSELTDITADFQQMRKVLSQSARS